MKKLALGILPLAVIANLLFVGCASQHTKPVYVYNGPAATSHTVVMTQAPPASQVEFESPVPVPVQVWIKGDWNFTHGKWIWMQGHWESRPHAGAIWISGHWDKDLESNEWIWTQGHWA
jgi:hypothetical protein